MRALAEELHRAGLACDILGEVQRAGAGIKLSAAVDVSTRRQAGASGQGAGDQGLAHPIGGRTGRAQRSNRVRLGDARQHRIDGSAREHRRPRRQAQGEGLARGALGVAGHEVEDLDASVISATGGAGDHPRGRVER